MKKILDLRVTLSERVGEQCTLLRALPVEGRLPECRPGQFAQLRADTPGVLLRRPVSIHDVEGDEISFLVQRVGTGTNWLCDLQVGDVLNAILPLGNGFAMPDAGARPLLVGGGVGVAPMLLLGKRLKEEGIRPTFLLGGRTRQLLYRLEAFRAVGDVYVTTEDGSLGERGFVTQHSIVQSAQFSQMYVCGPMPMMKAVACMAQEQGIPCAVSLENRMACGVGACLCCVTEDSQGHNRCVCTEGPVFDAQSIAAFVG